MTGLAPGGGTSGAAGRPRPLWWLALAVVVGIALGWVVVGLVSDAGSDPAAPQANPGQSQATSSGPGASSPATRPGPATSSGPAASSPAPTSAQPSNPLGAAYGVPTRSKTPVPDCRLSTLPDQVEDAVEAVYNDGPFLRSKDGSTFRNAERLLPTQREGFYREYTVADPGVDFPGPRRLVVGNRGTQWFFTSDHYDSFCEVLAG